MRELVAKDKDEILAEGHALLAQERRLAEKRQRMAAVQGTATLGQKIRAAREARGLTQADLAARTHVAQAYLPYLEQDQREPTFQSPPGLPANPRFRSTSWQTPWSPEANQTVYHDVRDVPLP